jgi:hypothetical protein
MLQTWIPSQPEKISPGNRFGTGPQTAGRVFKIIYILFSIEAGIFLLWLPWLSFWETNYVTFLYPQILPVVTNSFFKGAVIGLGIVNIMIGIHEIAHFKKYSKGIFYK